MKKFIFYFMILFVVKAYSQQIPLHTQYSENLYSVNPSVVGTTPYNPIILSYKQLWSGFDNAPCLYSLSSHFSLNDKVGIGGKAYSYKSGPISKTGFEGSYSYSLSLGANENSPKLAMGLSAFMYQYYLNKSDIQLENPNDNAFIYSSEKLIVPDAGFGTLLYGENYQIGLSVYQLFNRKVNLINKDYLDLRQLRHYYLHGGYEYEINSDYQISGNLLFKYIESGIFQADFTVKTIVKQFAWLGFSYRSNDAASVLLGFSKDKFAFGYAYDIVLTDIRRYSSGSHEIILIYNLPGIVGKRRSYLKETTTSM